MPDSTSNDFEDVRIGVIGQILFQSLLQELKIPHLVDYPIFNLPEHRIFVDFIIPGFGSIEVKSFPKHAEYFIVKKRLWDAMTKIPDYVIAIRVISDSLGKIEGYLLGSEVAGLPRNSDICRYEECYATPFTNLKPFKELVPKLIEYSIDDAIKQRVKEEFNI